MITFYYGPTPNGHKVAIFLEEAGLAYRVHPLNTLGGRQFEAAYLAISPSAKMPAIVDDDPPGGGEPFAVFESGAILMYLAGKAGQFLPPTPRERSVVEQWLFWQMAALGPMSGQASHFGRHAPPEDSPYARDRYRREVERLYAVLDHRLADKTYVAGEYSIADMAIHPWIRVRDHVGTHTECFPHLAAWFERVAARPRVAAAYALGGKHGHRGSTPTPEQEALMFAATADDMRRGYGGGITPWD